MTMKRSLAALRAAHADLTNVMRELALAIDDAPAADEHPAIVDALRAHATEVEGDLNETAAAIANAAEAEEHADAVRSVRALGDAHERFHAAGHRIRFALAGQANLFEIERVGGRRNGAWRGWSGVMLRQLEHVDDAFDRAGAAFIGCWQEIAERAVTPIHAR